MQVLDVATKDVWMASVNRDGTPSDGNVDCPEVSADGRTAVFVARASNLVGGSDRFSAIYLAERARPSTASSPPDRATGSAPTRVTEGADGSCFFPILSPNGRLVVFLSKATNLTTPRLARVERHVLIWDRDTRIFTLASSSVAHGPANGPSMNPCLSDDGSTVAFASWATNLAPEAAERATAGPGDREPTKALAKGSPPLASRAPSGVDDTGRGPAVYVVERRRHRVQRVSEVPYAAAPALSGDGRWVAFEGGEGPNRSMAIYLRDRGKGSSARASVISPPRWHDATSFRSPSISADGRFVAFSVPHPDRTCEVLVYDRTSGEIRQAAHSALYALRHLPRILSDGSAIWLVGVPSAVGAAEVPGSGAPPEEPEVIAARNPFLP
jgi:Tol biopolymer transport system component